MSAVLKEGLLDYQVERISDLQSHMITKWKVARIVLTGENLEFFSDDGFKKVDNLELKHVTGVVPSTKFKRPGCFEVLASPLAKYPNYFLAAPDDSDRDAWVEAVRLASERFLQENPTQRPPSFIAPPSFEAPSDDVPSLTLSAKVSKAKKNLIEKAKSVRSTTPVEQIEEKPEEKPKTRKLTVTETEPADRKEKMKKKVAYMRQMALEAQGGRENTAESPAVRKEHQVLLQKQHQLKKIVRSMNKAVEMAPPGIRAGRELANAVLESAEANEQTPYDGAILTQCLESVSEALTVLHNLQETLLNAVASSSATLAKVAMVDIRQAREVKTAFDRERALYDNALATVNALKAKDGVKEDKLHVAEEKVQGMKMVFNGTQRETLSILKDTNICTEFETVEKMANVLDSVGLFFQNGFKWFANVQPQVTQYRAYVADKQKVMENSKVRQTMRLTEAQIQVVTKTFGVPLESICQREATVVPQFCAQAILSLEQRGLQEEGVFRVSARQRDIQALKEIVDNGREPTVEMLATFDVHTVANALKLFLREMPEPLLTFGLYEEFRAVNVREVQPQARAEAFAAILTRLPPPNLALAHRLFRLLTQLAEHSAVNKMTPANVSVVLAPNVLYPKYQDPATMADDLKSANQIATTMIENFDLAFGFYTDPAPAAVPAIAISGPPSHPSLEQQFVENLQRRKEIVSKHISARLSSSPNTRAPSEASGPSPSPSPGPGPGTGNPINPLARLSARVPASTSPNNVYNSAPAPAPTASPAQPVPRNDPSASPRSSLLLGTSPPKKAAPKANRSAQKWSASDLNFTELVAQNAPSLAPTRPSEASQTERELEKELLDVDDFLAEYFDTPHGHRDTIDDNLDLLDEILAEHATDRL